MEIRLDRIDDLRVNTYTKALVADIEFSDNSEVINSFSINEIINAVSEESLLKEIGWEKVKEFFSSDIEELIEAKLVENAISNLKGVTQ